MLDRTVFEVNLNILLTIKDIAFNSTKNDCFYKLMANDFTNDNFKYICLDICKTENLYNKYPDIKLFYDRLPNNNALTLGEFKEKINDFINRCSDDCIYPDEISFTEQEKFALRQCGGLNSIKRDLKNYRHTGAIMKDLTDAFISFNSKFDTKESLTYNNQDVKKLCERKKCS